MSKLASADGMPVTFTPVLRSQASVWASSTSSGRTMFSKDGAMVSTTVNVAVVGVLFPQASVA